MGGERGERRRGVGGSMGLLAAGRSCGSACEQMAVVEQKAVVGGRGERHWSLEATKRIPKRPVSGGWGGRRNVCAAGGKTWGSPEDICSVLCGSGTGRFRRLAEANGLPSPKWFWGCHRQPTVAWWCFATLAPHTSTAASIHAILHAFRIHQVPAAPAYLEYRGAPSTSASVGVLEGASPHPKTAVGCSGCK